MSTLPAKQLQGGAKAVLKGDDAAFELLDPVAQVGLAADGNDAADGADKKETENAQSEEDDELHVPPPQGLPGSPGVVLNMVAAMRAEVKET
jgi:hypothetical protein